MASGEPAYRRTAVGGTFSLFHSGHRHLIKAALEVSDEVVIGVVSDEFASQRRKNHPVEPYEVRALRVLRYCLRKARVGQRITVLPLDDAEGPAGSDPSIEAIVVTEETLIGALKINRSRIAKKMKPLIIKVVEPILGDDGKPISSTKLWSYYYQNLY
ncbi:MAG: pantetheine-phosphate adenylyltransferase [Thermofilaceae archaeon]